MADLKDYQILSESVKFMIKKLQELGADEVFIAVGKDKKTYAASEGENKSFLMQVIARIIEKTGLKGLSIGLDAKTGQLIDVGEIKADSLTELAEKLLKNRKN